jgi:Tfp pilus assembly protein PilF
MFGGFAKTAWQHEADQKFIQMAVSGSDGDRKAAARKFAQMGWNFYQRGDQLKAVKRFNQAWLLDADDQYALWGFAVISVERGKIGQAIRFYEMAIRQGAPPVKLLEEYEGLTSPAP